MLAILPVSFIGHDNIISDENPTHSVDPQEVLPNIPGYLAYFVLGSVLGNTPSLCLHLFHCI